MYKTLLTGTVAALFSLFLAQPSQAQTPAAASTESPPPTIVSLEQQSRQAFAEGDTLRAYEVNMALHERLPYIGEYMVNIVRAAALDDRKTEAYEMMLKMQRQGLSYDFNQTDDTLKIRKTEVYMYVNDLMVEAAKPAGEGELAFKLAGLPADYQAITWDESREKFLVGTAEKGQVMAIAEDGSSELLLEANNENGLWSVNGLAVDPARNRLWISSAATPRFSNFIPTDRNHGALFEFNLETLERVGQYFVPIDALPHELGSLAVTDDGHVYVADRATPLVYRKTPDGKRLEAFVGAPDLLSLSDLAVAPDNSRLFVADRYKGVLVVDPVAEQAMMLGGPDNLNLGGIEGIEYAAGHLIIVQGGMQPQRLMRLKLAASGSAAESVAPMAVALAEYDRPGIGAIHGDSLYYFANTGAGEEAEGAVVMRTPLESGEAIVPPDIRKFQQSLKDRQQ
jgi:sugar lactone lactonase YvrE